MAGRKRGPKQAQQATVVLSAKWMTGTGPRCCEEGVAVAAGRREQRARARDAGQGAIARRLQPPANPRTKFTRPSRVQRRGSQSKRAYRHDTPTGNTSPALAWYAVRERAVRGWACACESRSVIGGGGDTRIEVVNQEFALPNVSVCMYVLCEIYKLGMDINI